MKKISVTIATVLTALIPQSVSAVPVVPNFTQGSMTSHTETTSTVTETINSMDYATGWQYTVTGTGIEVENGGGLSPADVSTTTMTIDGVTSTWTGLDLDNKPTFNMATPGAAFQFTESYAGPGLQNQTIIQRTTTIQSVTDTTSTFTQ